MSSAPPRVLVLGLNYPPEPTGVSPYTGAMARGLVRRGFVTRVLTAHPHYPDWRIKAGYGQWSRSEQIDQVSVTRLRHYVPAEPRGLRRAASETSFGIRLVTTKWGRPDAIVVVSPALLSCAVSAFRARITQRKTPFVVWVQDLYTLGLTETKQGRGIVVRAMAEIEGRLLRRADRVIVIHDRFADRVQQEFGIPREKIEVIRNWTHLAPTPDVDVITTREKLGWAPDEAIVLHAGNMGVKQGLDNVVGTARLAAERKSRVRFVLVGSGSQLERLKAAGAGIPNLEFVPPLDDTDFAAALQSADCLLVNELPGVSEMAVPSKLTSYFSAGRPVVAATDVDGITAEEIRNADAGVIVPSGNPTALLAAAETLAANPDVSRRLGLNGREYRHTVLDEESAIDKFTEMLTNLITQGEAVTTSAPTR